MPTHEEYEASLRIDRWKKTPGYPTDILCRCKQATMFRFIRGSFSYETIKDALFCHACGVRWTIYQDTTKPSVWE